MSVDFISDYVVFIMDKEMYVVNFKEKNRKKILLGNAQIVKITLKKVIVSIFNDNFTTIAEISLKDLKILNVFRIYLDDGWVSYYKRYIYANSNSISTQNTFINVEPDYFYMDSYMGNILYRNNDKFLIYNTTGLIKTIKIPGIFEFDNRANLIKNGIIYIKGEKIHIIRHNTDDIEMSRIISDKYEVPVLGEYILSRDRKYFSFNNQIYKFDLQKVDFPAIKKNMEIFYFTKNFAIVEKGMMGLFCSRDKILKKFPDAYGIYSDFKNVVCYIKKDIIKINYIHNLL